jgi:hypothetical protein
MRRWTMTGRQMDSATRRWTTTTRAKMTQTTRMMAKNRATVGSQGRKTTLLDLNLTNREIDETKSPKSWFKSQKKRKKSDRHEWY